MQTWAERLKTSLQIIEIAFVLIPRRSDRICRNILEGLFLIKQIFKDSFCFIRFFVVVGTVDWERAAPR